VRLRRAVLVLALAAGVLVASTATDEPVAQATSPGRTTTWFPDAPDPGVLRVGGRYFAYTTNRTGVFGGLLHVPVLRSGDLVNWTDEGDAFPDLPSWVEPGRTWAPAVMRDGDANVLFYAAEERRTGYQCIGKARATSPTGPFRDTRRGPIICQRGLGGSIDPYVFRDRDGTRYLLWKNDGNCCGHQVSLWSQRLREDERLAGRPHRLLSYDRSWERPLIENPAMVRSPDRNGEYRLFYAANWWESSSYATGFARCSGPLGPCRKVTTTGPWHGTTDYALGPGGASFFTDTGGRIWMAEHGWSNPPGDIGYTNGGRRSLYVEKVDFSDRRPRVNTSYPYRYEQDAPHPFVDVPSFADPAVTWAWRQDVVDGYDDGPDRKFRSTADMLRGDAVRQVRRSRPGHHVDNLRQVDSAITRGQAARLIYDAAGEPNVNGAAWNHDLTDVPNSLRDPVRYVVRDPDGNGPEEAIISAFPDDTFHPRTPISRAAWIRMLHRFRTDA
jgi:hypothetical protein